jgi:hypothetical protein
VGVRRDNNAPSPAIRRTILIACKEEFRLQKSVSIAVLFVFSGARMLAAQTMCDQDTKVHLNQIQVIGSHNS